MQRRFLWTNAGLERLINLAPNERLIISQYAVGDGNGTIPTPQKAQTTLVHEVHRANINNCQQDINDKKKYRIEIIIPAEVGGFWIREVGLYASDGVLIGVADHSEYYKPLPAEMIETKRIVLNAESINADQLEVVISTDAVIATHDFVSEQIEANKYTHPSNHPATMITEDSTHRFMTDTERTKLNGLNNYSHPSSHPATMITEDSTHRFVTDVEKSKWTVLEGNGSPEGVVISTLIGQLYKDLTNRIIYMKTTETGNTGWEDVAGKQKKRIVQNTHGFDGHFVYYNASGIWQKAIATTPDKIATHFAVKVDNNTFDAYIIGDFALNLITDSSGNALVSGEYYFLSNTVAGKVTKTKPTYDIGQAVLKTNSDYFNLEISEPQYIGRDLYNCPPIGTIFNWGLSVAPPGAIFAQGQTISAAAYSEFKDKIVASNDIDEYGVNTNKLYKWADAGHTLITLPNMSGRVIIGAGAGSGLTNRAIGEIGGEETHKLTNPEMPSHKHTFNGQNSVMFGGITPYANAGVAVGSQTSYAVMDNTGGDQPHNNMQPYIAVPVCIQLKYVTGVDPAIYSGNAQTLQGFSASAFAMVNGDLNNNFYAKYGYSNNAVVCYGQFAGLQSQTGYQKLPNGLILQWGTITPAMGSQTFTFPIAFPNACLGVFPCAMRSSENGTATLVSKTSTSAVINLFNFTNGANNMGATITAIGY